MPFSPAVRGSYAHPQAHPQSAGAFVLASAVPALAQPFTVNSTADEVDFDLADGACETASFVCTLRAAVQQANASPGPDTIIVPAGIYTLTLVGVEGPNDVLPKFGDLDITAAVTKTGAGASATIIEAGASILTAQSSPGTTRRASQTAEASPRLVTT